MSQNENAVYQRFNVSLQCSNPLKDVYGHQIRRALIAEGLYDHPIAHNHKEDGTTMDRRPGVLFRKGSMKNLVMVGINEGATYLRETPPPIGKTILVPTIHNGHVETTITGVNMQQAVDHITVGGFHMYETRSPILIAKSDAEKKMFGMLLEAEGDERKKLISRTLGRSIRRQIADLNSMNVVDVPRIQIVIETSRERVLLLKEKVSGFAYHGKFAANVLYSGGRFGVGIGRSTSTGFGIVEVQR